MKKLRRASDFFEISLGETFWCPDDDETWIFIGYEETRSGTERGDRAVFCRLVAGFDTPWTYTATAPETLCRKFPALFDHRKEAAA